ncbi:MAG: acylneuraminate cytidylyltransferase family protein [bacterium]
MRIVGFVPSKLNSERLPLKNIKLLGGSPLVNYCIKALNSVSSINETIIFASEPSICSHIEDGLKYKYVERPVRLDTQEATVQDFVNEFLKRDNADIIVLLHITAPFIKPETVAECVEKVSSGKYSSAFAAIEIKKFAWYNDKPLNYSLDKPIPRTQDILPIVVEQSGLYVFTRDLFLKKNQRVDSNSYIKIVDDFEGHDIDTLDDFSIAELMISSKLRSK